MPTITIQPNAANGIDTVLNDTAPTFNYGVNVAVGCGKRSDGVTVVGAINFNLTSISPWVRVISARIAMFDYNDAQRTANTTTNMFDIAPANNGWVEGTANGAAEVGSSCWNNKIYDTVNWAGSVGMGTAGVDYLDQVASATTVDGTTGQVNFDMNAAGVLMVERWIRTPALNYGVVLRGNGTPLAGEFNGFRSSDHSTAAQRPGIRIDYQVPDDGDKLLLLLNGGD